MLSRTSWHIRYRYIFIGNRHILLSGAQFVQHNLYFSVSKDRNSIIYYMNCSLGDVKRNWQWYNTRPTSEHQAWRGLCWPRSVLSWLDNFSFPGHLLNAINTLHIEGACDSLTHGERNSWERRERQKPQEVLLHPANLSTGHFVVITQTYYNSESAWRKKKVGFYSQFLHPVQSASCSIWTLHLE